MESWDQVWKTMISDERCKEEYKKAFLLNLFQKLCAKMNHDEAYKTHILNLVRQTSNTKEMVRSIYAKEYNYCLDDDDSELMCSLMNAYRKKHAKRKPIPFTTKVALFKVQNGLCKVCGQPLGNDWSKIHVDHIVPWVLVGDELDDNYQDLCETCNECKSSKTDFIFKRLIKLG